MVKMVNFILCVLYHNKNNKNGESRHPYLVPDFSVKSIQYFTIMRLLECFSLILFIKSKNFLLFLGC